MIKEILFRGKRKDNGEWVYGYYFQIPKLNIYEILTGKLDITSGIPIQERYDVIPETVGQYIGYTDKDENKIFEDDVLHCICMADWNIPGLWNFDNTPKDIEIKDIRNTPWWLEEYPTYFKVVNNTFNK